MYIILLLVPILKLVWHSYIIKQSNNDLNQELDYHINSIGKINVTNTNKSNSKTFNIFGNSYTFTVTLKSEISVDISTKVNNIDTILCGRDFQGNYNSIYTLNIELAQEFVGYVYSTSENELCSTNIIILVNNNNIFVLFKSL